MRRFILRTFIIVVLTVITISSKGISRVVVKNFNNSIENLCSYSVKTSNPLGF